MLTHVNKGWIDDNADGLTFFVFDISIEDLKIDFLNAPAVL